MGAGVDGVEVTPRFAQFVFDQQRRCRLLEDDLEKAIILIMGKDPDGNPDTWGFDDITLDDYDSSFELKSCTETFILTDEQKRAFAGLGFQQCWFCTKPAGVYDPGVHIWFPQQEHKP